MEQPSETSEVILEIAAMVDQSLPKGWTTTIVIRDPSIKEVKDSIIVVTNDNQPSKLAEAIMVQASMQMLTRLDKTKGH